MRNEDIPPALSTFVERVQAAVDELHAARSRLTSRKNVPLDVTDKEEDAMLEREQAIGAMNALEFEVAPALLGLDLQRIANEIASVATAAARGPRDMFTLRSNGPFLFAAVPVASVSGGRSYDVIARPQTTAFRVNELVIEHADRWRIDQIYVGPRAQLIDVLPCSATMISGVTLTLETIYTAMDFRIIATYTGPIPGGEEFSAIAFGPSNRIHPPAPASVAELERIAATIAHTQAAQLPFVPSVTFSAADAQIVLESMRQLLDTRVHHIDRVLSDNEEEI